MWGIQKFFIACLDGVQEHFDPLIENMSGIVGSIVSIATIFYIGSKVWSSYAKNEPIDVYPLLRPFVIAFLCANFTTCVAKPIDKMIEPISNYLFEQSENMTLKAIDDATAELDQFAKDNEKDDGFNVFKLGKWLIANLFKLICLIMEVIVNIIQMILTAILMISRSFFLSVLCIIGPIAFAISLFPGCQGGLMQWIGKYVSISFWLPGVYLVNIFCGALNAAFVTSVMNLIKMPGGGAFAFMGSLGIEIIIVLIGIIMCVVSYFCYTTIPTLSSWVITGGDTNGVQGMLGASSLMGMGAAAIGAKMGSNAIGGGGGGGTGGGGVMGALSKLGGGAVSGVQKLGSALSKISPISLASTAAMKGAAKGIQKLRGK